MSFLGGPECSTAGNPLTQFTKHVQNDNTLQRDRLVGRGPGGLEESMRSRVAPNGSDHVCSLHTPIAARECLPIQAMNEFMQQPGPQPFAMEQMRQDLPHVQNFSSRTSSPGFAPTTYADQNANMEAAFASSRMGTGEARMNGFSPQEYARYQHASQSSIDRTASPTTQTSPWRPSYQSQMGMNYMPMNMGMGYSGMQMQQQPDMSASKGKGKLVELDDQHWEEQFKELDQDNMSEQANAAMERELEEVDRLVDSDTDHYGDFESIWTGIQAEHADRQMTEDPQFDANVFSDEDLNAWENFDSGMGTNTHPAWQRDPLLGDYMFESNNPFLEANASQSAFDQGMELMRTHGNLSLAALAFEAAVQQDPNHVEAWSMLGSAQAQNEKEAPAIRALEKTIQLDPNNLGALMGLAVSYINEGYESTAYRTLERWLSVKYPQIHPPDQLSSASDIGYTEQAILHEKATNLFIRAAQLSPCLLYTLTLPTKRIV